MPSTNTAFESWLPRVAPEGVSFHTARMPLSRGIPLAEALAEMEKHEHAAVQRVMDCEPDALLFACTASSIAKGIRGDQELIAMLQAQTGIPCTTITAGILQAFSHLGVRRISIGSPYPAALDEMESEFFSNAGLEVMGTRGLGIADPAEICDVPPGEIYRFARSVCDPNAQGLLLTCGAFRAQYVAAALEQDLNIPVVTSITATLWASLRLAGVMASVPGYGRLLSDPGRPYRDQSG
jgi:maleate cis-trans isomerase